MIRQRKTIVVLATVGVLVLGSCRSSGKVATPTTKASAPTTTVAGSAAPTTTTASTAAPGTTTAETTPGTTGATSGTAAPDTTVPSTEAAKPWAVDTSACADPAKVKAPITGTLTIGSAQPLSGPVAGAFAPVTDGLNLYFDYANAQKLLPDVTLKTNIGDDQYDPTKTPTVVSGIIDSGVDMFTGIIGTEDNDAVRDTLNSECIPQLNALTGSPEWGNDVAHFPWTTGALVPYDIEAQIYADKIKELKGAGATVGLFSVNNDFGKVFHDAFKAAADKDGLKIVDDQTIEPADQAPPTNQVGSIAGNKPDTVVTVPLGIQCPIFLKELANQEAVNTDWKPVVFLTNTCASRLLISALAGGTGDGVYTSSNLIDPQDPKNADNAGYKTFKAAYDAKGLKGDIATTAVGWAVGEITLNILEAAQKSGTLSRESIINAARNLTFVPSLARDGTVYKMNGLADTYPFQSLTVVQWNEKTGLYTDIGTENTSFES